MANEADLRSATPCESSYAFIVGARRTNRALSWWPEWSALSLYAALVAIAIPYHEPGVDEAQAWQLARSLSLGSLFKTYIRYEASPGLWHFLLWLMVHAHLSYTGLHWISGAIAVAGVSLLIFHAPLPRYLRLAFPFTYFLVFQYAVVARNYVLAPLLFFWVAMQWKKSPLGVAIGLGLLANVSLHTAVLSGGLACVYAIEQVRQRKTGILPSRRKLILSILVLVALYAFALWTAWPPHDMALSRVRGDSRAVLTNVLGSLAWGILDPMPLSVPFWIVIGVWLHGRHKLFYLIPVLLFSIFCGEVHVAFWHAGLLVPCLICLIWLSWPEPGSGARQELLIAVTLGVMIVTQILWSGYAIFYDHYDAYSPDLVTARFLKPYVDRHETIVATSVQGDPHWRGHAYPAVGILPYFDHNIFANTPYMFWWWSDRDASEARFNALLPSHPRIVLVEFASTHPVPQPDPDDPAYTNLFRDGYVHRNTFCGSQPQGFGLGVTVCHVVFEYPR